MLDASQVKLRELYLKTARRVQFHPRFSRRDLRKCRSSGATSDLAVSARSRDKVKTVTRPFIDPTVLVEAN